MDLSLAITLIATTVASVSAVFSFFHSKQAIKISEKDSRLATAVIELEISKQISDARIRVFEYGRYAKGEKGEKDKLHKEYLVEVEGLLNAYENGCSLYDDDKLDKQRFKKTYYSDIQRWVERESLREHFFSNTITKRFPMILKVYNEWIASNRE